MLQFALFEHCVYNCREYAKRRDAESKLSTGQAIGKFDILFAVCFEGNESSEDFSCNNRLAVSGDLERAGGGNCQQNCAASAIVGYFYL